MYENHFEVRLINSDEHAAARRRELDIDRDTALQLGDEALYINQGWNAGVKRRRVAWFDAVENARKAKISIPPDAQLPDPGPSSHTPVSGRWS